MHSDLHRALCTGVEWQGDRLEGSLTTPNRRGAEKARCVEALRVLHPQLPIVAYANAASDLEHLALADRATLVNGSWRARRAAARAGIACAQLALRRSGRRRSGGCDLLRGRPVYCPRRLNMLTRVPRIAPSEITPPQVYFNRRALLAGALASGASALLRAAEDSAGAGRCAQLHAQSAVFGERAAEQVRGDRRLQQLLRVRHRQGLPAPNTRTRCRTRPWSVTVHGEAEVTGTFNLEDLLKDAAARGAHLPLPLRGGLVAGRAVGGIPAEQPAGALQADLEGEVRRVHHALRPAADARAARAGAQLAVRRGAAHR